MAIAASAIPHVHLGSYQEDETSDSDIDDSLTCNHGGLVHEEINFGLLFQNTLCIDLSEITVHQEIDEASSTNNHSDLEHQVEVSSIVETDVQCEINSDKSIDTDAMTKESGNDECSIFETKMESTEVNMCVNSNSTTASKVTVKEIEIASILDQYSFGKPKRANKRYRQERRDERRKGFKSIDPSEVGFDFCCTRSLVVISNYTTHLDTKDEENEKAADSASSCKESASDAASIDAEASTSTMDNNQELESENRNSDTKLNITSETTHLQDDRTFFGELGIDINDSGSFEWGDCLDWDDLTFSPPKPKSRKSSSAKKSESRNTKYKQKTKEDAVVKTIDTYFEFSSRPNYRMSTYEQTRLFNLECSSSPRVYLRKDRHRKHEKLHKAVKTQHCTILNIMNNPGGGRIHMHHRNLQKANINIDFRFFARWHIPPMPKSGVDLSVAKAIRIKTASTPIYQRPAPAQNLRHVLHETNVPRAIEMDLASFLLSIQNRDLTPEDYEMLLRLDDTVKAKTVSKNVVDNLKTDIVGEDIANILNCVICMEPYLVGQTRKFLPCDHDFHSDCIDSWLTNNSQNCPLDGLSIADS